MEHKGKATKNIVELTNDIHSLNPQELEQLEFQQLKARADKAIKEAKESMQKLDKALARVERIWGIKKRPLTFPLGEA